MLQIWLGTQCDRLPYTWYTCFLSNVLIGLIHTCRPSCCGLCLQAVAIENAFLFYLSHQNPQRFWITVQSVNDFKLIVTSLDIFYDRASSYTACSIITRAKHNPAKRVRMPTIMIGLSSTCDYGDMSSTWEKHADVYIKNISWHVSQGCDLSGFFVTKISAILSIFQPDFVCFSPILRYFSGFFLES